MNEIVQKKNKTPVTTGANVAGLIPQTIEEAFRVATAVSAAGMAPYGMDTPEKCLIAVMSGAEVGLPPMQSIQNIAVINNRPCMWGDAVIGVVRASGFSRFIKETIEGEGDDMVAICETQRIDEDQPTSRTFSVQDAIKAGLWQTEARVTRYKKNGGGSYEVDNDSPWYKHPKRMLQMRARAFCLRDVYADVLKGLQVREEVEDHHKIENKNEPKQLIASDAASRYSNVEAPSEVEDLKRAEVEDAEVIEENPQEEKKTVSDEENAPELFTESSATEAPPLEKTSVAEQPEVEKTPFEKARPGLIEMMRQMMSAIDERGETSLVAVKAQIESLFEQAKKAIKAKSYPEDVMYTAEDILGLVMDFFAFNQDEKTGRPLNKVSELAAEKLKISEDELLSKLYSDGGKS